MVGSLSRSAEYDAFVRGPLAMRLKTRYQTYRVQQARELLRVMPRDAVRPLYRSAHDWAAERGEVDTTDPMATLVQYVVDEVLPLPPFEDWAQDFVAHPDAYLEVESDDAAVRPAVLATRTVMHEGMPWSAHLEVFSVDDAWRGFIRFDEGAAGRATRTADIFAEERVDLVRDRFVGFHDQTLQAFLRSTLP